MKRTLILFCIIFSHSLSAQVEMKYNAGSKNLPKWVALMYSENPDEGAVINAYTDYYKKHKLVKNKHTQYYKRWIRSLSRTTSSVLNYKQSQSSGIYYLYKTANQD